MKQITTLVASVCLTVSLAACSSTESPDQAPIITELPPNSPLESVMQPMAPSTASGTITLNQIMSDPDWLGRAPSGMGWSVDGSALVYDRKREGSVIRDSYAALLSAPSQSSIIPLSDIHEYRFDERVVRDDGVIAYSFEDSIYIRFVNGDTVLLNKGGQTLNTLTFMTDGRLMAYASDHVVAIDLASGQREELLRWAFADRPQAVKPPKDLIAEEQISLIEYIQTQRNNRLARAEAESQLALQNGSVARDTFYFDKGHRIAGMRVSPAGNFAVVATTKSVPSRDDSDIMPHYIQEDGRIASKKVRRRVADAESVNHDLWLLNLSTGEKQPLSFVSLPGYNDDVLADVKRENALARGEEYQDNRLPREITLLSSWYWTEPSIRWHKSGEHVAVMLEAWDNKDRWIATVDLDTAKLNTQHRLHDGAWVNYRFNAFGWLSESPTLYYQSEHTGYAHLYVQVPGETPKALTYGEYIVDSPVVTTDDQFIYYTANQKHPGIYEVYRVNVESGEIQAVTDLNGKTEFSLSPDNETLLLSHSKVTQPPELFVLDADGHGDAKRITHTVSEQFLSLPWAAPQVIEIPSSHTDAPIYARVYLPEGYDKGTAKRAVVFNHGAGYLQNAHMGWSGYFREFMFHSMLVQQGYVVLDMDYRASAGYGRDWRTAIYRQMGTPEVQDLRDGVNWLVENVNVDRDRIGTYGGSYGGFLTFMSMFNAPDLFAAGAALRPVTDWAHYNTPYTSNILNTPNVDPIAYRKSSPIYYAEGLEKPLLINAPMVDDNVFFVDTVRLVQRLIELEKEDFETAIYPVEPHGFVQPSSWLDEYRRIYKLFEENL